MYILINTISTKYIFILSSLNVSTLLRTHMAITFNTIQLNKIMFRYCDYQSLDVHGFVYFLALSKLCQIMTCIINQAMLQECGQGGHSFRPEGLPKIKNIFPQLYP